MTKGGSHLSPGPLTSPPPCNQWLLGGMGWTSPHLRRTRERDQKQERGDRAEIEPSGKDLRVRRSRRKTTRRSSRSEQFEEEKEEEKERQREEGKQEASPGKWHHHQLRRIKLPLKWLIRGGGFFVRRGLRSTVKAQVKRVFSSSERKRPWTRGH